MLGEKTYWKEGTFCLLFDSVSFLYRYFSLSSIFSPSVWAISKFFTAAILPSSSLQWNYFSFQPLFAHPYLFQTFLEEYPFLIQVLSFFFSFLSLSEKACYLYYSYHCGLTRCWIRQLPSPFLSCCLTFPYLTVAVLEWAAPRIQTRSDKG